MKFLRNLFNPYARRDEIMAILNTEARGRFTVIHKALRETCDDRGHCDLEQVVAHIRKQTGQNTPAP
ncbi:MAG: hypothetical protein KKA05_04185 [Alphaproteobacteria bacterium]|nr:hypothetical protein [Alphaproteobacteria bacterium]MBU0860100.1 hypothetical protein [Alphaproteobacteria bacterium]